MSVELDYGDIVEAVKEGTRAGQEANDRPGPICPIQPFAGVDTSGRQVQAIGVVWHEDMMQFVCIVSDPDDESIYPIMLETVFPPGTAPQDLPELPPITTKSRDGLPMAFRKPLQWPSFDSRFKTPQEDA